jgi:hypothetical protein
VVLFLSVVAMMRWSRVGTKRRPLQRDPRFRRNDARYMEMY